MACGGDVRTSAGGVVVGARDDAVGCLVHRFNWNSLFEFLIVSLFVIHFTNRTTFMFAAWIRLSNIPV